MLHAGAGPQGFGLSPTAFPGHRQGAEWEAGPPGLELPPMWDPGVCKMRTVATSNILKASLLKFTYLFQTLISVIRFQGTLHVKSVFLSFIFFCKIDLFSLECQI